jgi:hypothetical protein
MKIKPYPEQAKPQEPQKAKDFSPKNYTQPGLDVPEFQIG